MTHILTHWMTHLLAHRVAHLSHWNIGSNSIEDWIVVYIAVHDNWCTSNQRQTAQGNLRKIYRKQSNKLNLVSHQGKMIY